MKRLTPLNKEEQKYLRDEMLNRLKDIFFMNVEHRVNQMVEKFSSLTFNESDTLRFTWEVTMLGFDVLQIVGRIRRVE